MVSAKNEELQLRQKNPTNEMSLIPMDNSPREEDEVVDYVPVFIKRKTGVFGPPVIRSNKPKHYVHSVNTSSEA